MEPRTARGIDDIYELTCVRKDTSRFPAVVSETALRDAQKAIIGYLLIGADKHRAQARGGGAFPRVERFAERHVSGLKS